MINISKIVVTDTYDGVELKDGEYMYDRINDVMYIGFTNPISNICVGRIKANVKLLVQPIRKYNIHIPVSPKYPYITLINSLGEYRKININLNGKGVNMHTELKINAKAPRNINININNANGYNFKANLIVKGGT